MNDERLNVLQQLTEGVTLTITSYSDNLMASRLIFQAKATAPLHHHPEDELHTVLSGRFECTIDGKVQVLETGDSVHVRPDQVHSLHALEAGEILTVWGPVRNDLLKIFVRGPGRPVLEG